MSQLEIVYRKTSWVTPRPGDRFDGKTVKATRPRCDGGAEVHFTDGTKGKYGPLGCLIKGGTP